MSNVIRFVTNNKKSKKEIIKSKNSSCEIIIFPGIRYSWSDNSEMSKNKAAKRRRNAVKTSIEQKRKRGA